MISHILVPLDGSELAEVVLPHVEDLAGRLKARVTFLQVVESGLNANEAEAITISDVEVAAERTEREVKSANEYLSRLATAWQGNGIDARWQVELEQRLPKGTPATKIIEMAHAVEADMIAMSTHGRSGLSRMFFGSVADQVLRESGIPLLVIRASHTGKGTEHAG